MHTILIENGFADSIWCKQILQGLTLELKKRREPYRILCDGETVQDTVFVIGSSPHWLGAMVSRCNRAGLVPILLCSSHRKIPGGRYHIVRPDIAGSMQQLVGTLRQRGQRLALYGVNPDSVGDRSSREAFILECPDGLCFENRGCLRACFERFLPTLDQVDAVICTNGFAAISLYHRLKERGISIPIISYAQTLLCRRYEGAITSVNMHYDSFGKTALGIADLARRQSHISELTATVQWSVAGLEPGELPSVATCAPTPDTFYDDKELQQMLKLEDLLGSCDDIDRQLLDMLLEGQSYMAMAERCFLTEGAVKYRIRALRQICDCPDRESLETLLRTYLP